MVMGLLLVPAQPPGQGESCLTMSGMHQHVLHATVLHAALAVLLHSEEARIGLSSCCVVALAVSGSFNSAGMSKLCQ